jgi:hypothetical protein
MAIIKVRSARETRTVIAPLAREEKTGGLPSFLSSISNLSNNAIRMRKDPNQVSPQVGVSLVSVISPPANITIAIHTHAAMLPTSEFDRIAIALPRPRSRGGITANITSRPSSHSSGIFPLLLFLLDGRSTHELPFELELIEGEKDAHFYDHNNPLDLRFPAYLFAYSLYFLLVPLWA